MLFTNLINKIKGPTATQTSKKASWMPTSLGSGALFSGESSSGYPVNDYTALTYSP